MGPVLEPGGGGVALTYGLGPCDVERAVDHLEEPRVRIGWEVGFGLGRVLEEGVQTGLGWVVLGTADRDPVEET